MASRIVKKVKKIKRDSIPDELPTIVVTPPQKEMKVKIKTKDVKNETNASNGNNMADFDVNQLIAELSENSKASQSEIETIQKRLVQQANEILKVNAFANSSTEPRIVDATQKYSQPGYGRIPAKNEINGALNGISQSTRLGNRNVSLDDILHQNTSQRHSLPYESQPAVTPRNRTSVDFSQLSSIKQGKPNDVHPIVMPRNISSNDIGSVPPSNHTNEPSRLNVSQRNVTNETRTNRDGKLGTQLVPERLQDIPAASLSNSYTGMTNSDRGNIQRLYTQAEAGRGGFFYETGSARLVAGSARDAPTTGECLCLFLS